MSTTAAAAAMPPAGPAAPSAVADDEGLDRRRLAVVSAQASSLRWQIIATAAVVAVVVWPFVPAPAVLAWLALAIGLREWRALHLRRMEHDTVTPLARLLPRVVAWNLVLGLCNGAAALFMLWLDTTYDALLTMILVSWAAGAVSTSAPLLRAYLAFSSAVFAPTAAIWAVGGSVADVGVAALILMFAGVQYRFATQNAAVFEESYRMRQENEALVRELAQARDAAEAANQAKSRFLAAASHDLRQPLHALTLHSGLLAQDPQGPDAPQIAQALSGSIDSLGRLLDSLLDISKLDAGVVRVERRPIRLQRLLAHLVHTHRPQAAEKGLALASECPPEAVVHTDPLLLERLLRNLVDNALKYTDRGGVQLRAQADGEQWRIEVADSGRGIPDHSRERVFEEFFRVDDGAAERGLGLGLAIVRRLGLLLGLAMTLHSRVGEGTTVTLRLPRLVAPAEEAPAAAAPAAALQRLRVLVVDDDAAVRRAMQRVLQRFGCEAIDAASSEEALERAAATPPDLVLADWRLRDGDTGLAAIARLRERRPGLPALLISGDTDDARLREAERDGLRVLAKPLTLARLREAIAQVLPAQAAAAREAAP